MYVYLVNLSQVKIYYVDYGNQEEQMVVDLINLPGKYLWYPFQVSSLVIFISLCKFSHTHVSFYRLLDVFWSMRMGNLVGGLYFYKLYFYYSAQYRFVGFSVTYYLENRSLLNSFQRYVCTSFFV